MNLRALLIDLAVYAWINGDRAARQRLWVLHPGRHGKSAWTALLRDFHAMQISNKETTR